MGGAVAGAGTRRRGGARPRPPVHGRGGARPRPPVRGRGEARGRGAREERGEQRGGEPEGAEVRLVRARRGGPRLLRLDGPRGGKVCEEVRREEGALERGPVAPAVPLGGEQQEGEREQQERRGGERRGGPKREPVAYPLPRAVEAGAGFVSRGSSSC